MSTSATQGKARERDTYVTSFFTLTILSIAVSTKLWGKIVVAVYCAWIAVTI